MDLLRVVAGPAVRVRGLRVASVELYGDGVVLHWHDAHRWTDGPGTPRVWSRDDMETADADAHVLADDLGTRYAGGCAAHFGIDGGGWSVRFGTSSFTPAVPPGARRLRLRSIDIGL